MALSHKLYLYTQSYNTCKTYNTYNTPEGCRYRSPDPIIALLPATQDQRCTWEPDEHAQAFQNIAYLHLTAIIQIYSYIVYTTISTIGNRGLKELKFTLYCITPAPPAPSLIIRCQLNDCFKSGVYTCYSNSYFFSGYLF